MYFSTFTSSNWATFTTLILSTLNLVSAYRPVQHCKHIGDNGHYSACTALTQTYNATTGNADLYLRYNWYRYQDQKHGWHTFAIGEQMAGAHMIMMYGDPTAPYGAMTVSVRTADGHHPPRPVDEFSRFDNYFVPAVEIVTAKFEEYTGPFFHEKLQLKPSHVGVMEAVIRSWALWPGVKIDNSSSHQAMLWSSNYKQDFLSDFSVDRNIEMHMFGLGFGFLWVDMQNAETPFPMFGPLNELAGMKGVNEFTPPAPPTDAELQDGEAYIEAVRAIIKSAESAESTSGTPTTTSPPTIKPTSTTEDEFAAAEPDDGAIPDPINPGDGSRLHDLPGFRPENPPPESTLPEPVQQPAKTVMGKTLRDWMWHLHGLLMTMSFLFLYPLGVYLLRRPPATANGSGFNSHWTLQVLGSVSTAIGAAIGYVNSRSISVSHQYVGLFLIVALATQMFLGWRHHVIYLATKRKTLFAKIHMWNGRTILPLGYLNIILGMLLRHYGWLTITLVLIFIILQLAFLVFVLRGASNARIDTVGASRSDAQVRQDDAEEYFQLGGDDDDDWEESDGENNRESEAAKVKADERRRQQERLSRLDKV